MKKNIFILTFLFTAFFILAQNKKIDFSYLSYNLTKEQIISLWGNPDKILDGYVEVLVYKKDDAYIYLNFYTDNKLSYVWMKDSEDKHIEVLPMNHSFFTDSKSRGNFKNSGYDSEQLLLKRNYKQKYFYFSQFFHEYQLYEQKQNKDTSINSKVSYYAFQEDRIIYTFWMFGDSKNYTACAYILPDTELTFKDVLGLEIDFIKYDKNNDGIIEKEEGSYFNNQYYLEVTDSSRKKFINFDKNRDGKTEKNEGLYIFY